MEQFFSLESFYLHVEELQSCNVIFYDMPSKFRKCLTREFLFKHICLYYSREISSLKVFTWTNFGEFFFSDDFEFMRGSEECSEWEMMLRILEKGIFFISWNSDLIGDFKSAYICFHRILEEKISLKFVNIIWNFTFQMEIFGYSLGLKCK